MWGPGGTTWWKGVSLYQAYCVPRSRSGSQKFWNQLGFLSYLTISIWHKNCYMKYRNLIIITYFQFAWIVISGDQCVGAYLILLIITGSSFFGRKKWGKKKSSVSSYFKNLKELTGFIMKVVFFSPNFWELWLYIRTICWVFRAVVMNPKTYPDNCQGFVAVFSFFIMTQHWNQPR